MKIYAKLLVVGYYNGDDETFFNIYTNSSTKEAAYDAFERMAGFGVVVAVIDGVQGLLLMNHDDVMQERWA